MHDDALPRAARRTVAALRRSPRARRRLAFLAAVALFEAAAAVPAYAADAASPVAYQQAAWHGGCRAAVALTPGPGRSTAPGVDVRTWDGVQPDGMPTRLTVAALDLARVRLVAQAQPLGSLTRLSRLAADLPGALVLANGGYFDNRSGVGATGHLPVGPEVLDGHARTLHPRATAYVGVDEHGRVHAGLLRAGGTAQVLPRGADDDVQAGRAGLLRAARSGPAARTEPAAGAQVLAVAAVNPPHLPARGVVALTAEWAGEHPGGDWDVLVQDDRVIYSGAGAPLAAHPGATLLTARGADAERLSRIRTGQYVRLQLGARDGRWTITEALGRGEQVVTDSAISAGCGPVTEQVRPRTLLGWSADGRTAYLVSVSAGRRDVYSQHGRAGGATFRQTAAMLLQAGVANAVMLDGGGSSELVARTPGQAWQRLDLPDGARERSVANAWAVLPR
ncbi:MAG: phosphodiester glycosidase family protein [Motilibacteraceae bacterium]